MGISTIQSYQGSQIFEAIGISADVIDKYFTGTVSRVGGITLEDIAKDVDERHSQAPQIAALLAVDHCCVLFEHLVVAASCGLLQCMNGARIVAVLLALASRLSGAGRSARRSRERRFYRKTIQNRCDVLRFYFPGGT